MTGAKVNCRECKHFDSELFHKRFVLSEGTSQDWTDVCRQAVGPRDLSSCLKFSEKPSLVAKIPWCQRLLKSGAN